MATKDAPRAPGTILLAARATGRRALPAIAPIAAAAAAATAATAASTAATATAAAVAAAATKATAATAAALGTLFSLVDAKGTSVEVRPIHGLDGLLGLSRRAHRHKPEPARLTRCPIGHDVNVGHLADSRERLTNSLTRRRKRQVADIQTRSHVSLSSSLTASKRASFKAPVQCLPSNRPQNQKPGRDGGIRRVHTLVCRRSRAAVPWNRESSRCRGNVREQSKHNGQSCPRKLLACLERLAPVAEDASRAGHLGRSLA
jgi:hypothetical protein